MAVPDPPLPPPRVMSNCVLGSDSTLGVRDVEKFAVMSNLPRPTSVQALPDEPLVDPHFHFWFQLSVKSWFEPAGHAGGHASASNPAASATTSNIRATVLFGIIAALPMACGTILEGQTSSVPIRGANFLPTVNISYK